MLENRKELANYRLESARDCLAASAKLLNDNLYKDSINRSYYAIFHAMRAVMALDKSDFKKHSAVISFFNKNYIKTGKLDNKFSGIIQNAFNIRNDSDYEDFFIVSRDEAQAQYYNAKVFIEAVEDYLDTIFLG